MSADAGFRYLQGFLCRTHGVSGKRTDGRAREVDFNAVEETTWNNAHCLNNTLSHKALSSLSKHFPELFTCELYFLLLEFWENMVGNMLEALQALRSGDMTSHFLLDFFFLMSLLKPSNDAQIAHSTTPWKSWSGQTGNEKNKLLSGEFLKAPKETCKLVLSGFPSRAFGVTGDAERWGLSFPFGLGFSSRSAVTCGLPYYAYIRLPLWMKGRFLALFSNPTFT